MEMKVTNEQLKKIRAFCGQMVENNPPLSLRREAIDILDAALAAPEQEPVAHYGIIDPDYARVFTMARCLAWQEGYALAMHGSFTRDLDLIAIPWTDSACDPEHLVRRIVQAADLEMHRGPGEKPHGRLAFTLMFKGFGDPRFIDLSVAQRQQTTVAAPQREWQGLTKDEINDCAGAEIYPSTWAMDFARAIESKLKEKNHG